MPSDSDQLDLRFEQALKSGGLNALARELKAEGMRQEQMYWLFDCHRADHVKDADESYLDAIMDTMDAIVGWGCHRDYWLFDSQLTFPPPPIQPPPAELDGANVLKWVRREGHLYFIPHGNGALPVFGLAICPCRSSPPHQGSIHLFECDWKWEVMQDPALYLTVDEAMTAAKQRGVAIDEWQSR